MIINNLHLFEKYYIMIIGFIGICISNQNKGKYGCIQINIYLFI